MDEFYTALKEEIKTRFFDKSKSCNDLRDEIDLRRAQGAASELGSLIDFMECLENPPQEDKQS